MVQVVENSYEKDGDVKEGVKVGKLFAPSEDLLKEVAELIPA